MTSIFSTNKPRKTYKMGPRIQLINTCNYTTSRRKHEEVLQSRHNGFEMYCK